MRNLKTLPEKRTERTHKYSKLKRGPSGEVLSLTSLSDFAAVEEDFTSLTPLKSNNPEVVHDGGLNLQFVPPVFPQTK